jgi:hypothetical protein
VADDDEAADFEEIDGMDVVLRQVMDSVKPGQQRNEVTEPKKVPPKPEIAPLPVESFTLPDLSEVKLTVVPPSERVIRARAVEKSPYSNPHSYWTPRSPADIERDRKVGDRGEGLVYRLQIERSRELGYDNPESMVIWSSTIDPGADHDIRIIGDDPADLWIEVKSTLGSDGRFEWYKKEFEKALREGDRYDNPCIR